MKDDDYWSISDDSSSLVRTAPDDCCSISSVTASSYEEETLAAGSSRSAKIGISLLFASALGLFAVSSIRQTSSTEELSSLMATTVTEHGRQLQDDNDSNTPLVYSKMATIVPDPTHPISDKAKKEAKEKFGAWGFWDGDESMRPTDDYCAKAPNRDVVEFPDTAWQNDAVFVNHYLNDAEQLVGRTMEAIFTEYGWGIDQWPADQKAWVMKERLKMYHVEYVEDEDFANDDFTAPEKYLKRGTHGSGGWSTKRSFDGLVRRLLHAMTTNDEFVVVLGGHSSAAGHGNHFRQSYMHQFHKVMSPVFARLGVKLRTHNFSQGGLGTIQSAMGMKSLYGDNIDLLVWDSGMTEGNKADIEYFFRQGLISGKKVPMLWGNIGNYEWQTLRFLYNHADVDFAVIGTGVDGIPETRDIDHSESLPFAARNMKCGSEARDLCTKDRFCASCWVDRPDVPRESFTNIETKVPSQVRWHNGWRSHQLQGRVMSLLILDALQASIQIWSDGTQGGPPLDESEWHVTEYYDNIRHKLKNLDDDAGLCPGIDDRLPKRVCKTAMQARGLYTPRARPHETSLLNIIKGPAEIKPKQTKKMLYDTDDVPFECFETHEGEVDVLAVASGRRQLSHLSQKAVATDVEVAIGQRQLADKIELGKGWQHVDEFPGNCDGGYYSHCGRFADQACPMLGHHDSRGAVVGNEFSGWMVLEIPKVEEGLIMIKIYSRVNEASNTITEGWTKVNNGGRQLRSETPPLAVVDGSTYDLSDSDYIDGQPDQRLLSSNTLPDSFRFDYAINGKVTTLDKEEFHDMIRPVQRVVEVLVLLDDKNFGTQENVEVAFRMRGCGRECTMGLTHAYWA